MHVFWVVAVLCDLGAGLFDLLLWWLAVCVGLVWLYLRNSGWLVCALDL